METVTAEGRAGWQRGETGVSERYRVIVGPNFTAATVPTSIGADASWSLMSIIASLDIFSRSSCTRSDDTGGNRRRHERRRDLRRRLLRARGYSTWLLYVDAAPCSGPDFLPYASTW